MLLAGVVVFLVAACGSQPQPCSPGRHASAAQPTTVAEGLYESCAPGTTAATLGACTDRLATMAQGGFGLVINYDVLDASPGNLTAYAQFAASKGVKLAWSIEAPGWWNLGDDSQLTTYADLKQGCPRCRNNRDLAGYIVNLVKHLPTTWAYYIADEPDRSKHAAVKQYAQYIRSLDAGHPTMLVSSEDCGTLGANVRPFTDAADIVGVDYYPVGTSDCTVDSWTSIAKAVQTYAVGNAGTIMVAQAFCWCESATDKWVCPGFPACAHYPTESEMAQEKALISRGSSPLVIMWYAFFEEPYDTPVSADLPAHWADMIEAAVSGEPPRTSSAPETPSAPAPVSTSCSR